jgi:hypothetical protein
LLKDAGDLDQGLSLLIRLAVFFGLGQRLLKQCQGFQRIMCKL